MVEAAKSAAETKTLLAGKNTSAPNKLLAGSVMALYGLVEALLEKALLPLAEHYKTPTAVNQYVNTTPPTPSPTRTASSGWLWRGPTKRLSSLEPNWVRRASPTRVPWHIT